MINRRGFFGASAGAAIAGPQVAKMALDKASINTMKEYGGSASWGNYGPANAKDTEMSVSDHVSMIRHQIECVAKNKARHDRPYLSPDTLAALRIDALRSISPQHKARRAIEISYKIRQEREVEEGENYIERLKQNFKEKFPLIANLEDLING